MTESQAFRAQCLREFNRQAAMQQHPHNWGNIVDPFYYGTGNVPANSLRPDNAKPARKDLTPRQIEWCRENLFKRKEKVVT